MNAKSAIPAIASLLTALTSGCASITGTTIQSVSVQTIDAAGKDVTGSACELNNKKGKWFITSPGTATITRSNDDLMVLCKKENHEPGMASVVSAIKGSMFGNILFGGGIGAIIDHNSGSAYEYPSVFQIQMGSNRAIDMTKPEGQQIVSKRMNAKPDYSTPATASTVEVTKPKVQVVEPPSAISQAPDWTPRIALLEKSRGQLTFSKAMAILLDIDSDQEVRQLLTFEEWVKGLRWNTAFAMGNDGRGNIFWGGAYAERSEAFAVESAQKFCASTAGISCKAIMVNGNFDEQAFVEAAKMLGARPVAEVRTAFLESIKQTPNPVITGYAHGAIGNEAAASKAFASIKP